MPNPGDIRVLGRVRLRSTVRAEDGSYAFHEGMRARVVGVCPPNRCDCRAVYGSAGLSVFGEVPGLGWRFIECVDRRNVEFLEFHRRRA